MYGCCWLYPNDYKYKVGNSIFIQRILLYNNISIINCPYLKLFAHFYRGWTCDDCIREVGLIATQYSLPHISHHWKNYLSHQGKIINRHVICIKMLRKYLLIIPEIIIIFSGYCHDEDLDFSPPEVEACQYYIHKFISPALSGLLLYYWFCNTMSACPASLRVSLLFHFNSFVVALEG